MQIVAHKSLQRLFVSLSKIGLFLESSRVKFNSNNKTLQQKEEEEIKFLEVARASIILGFSFRFYKGRGGAITGREKECSFQVLLRHPNLKFQISGRTKSTENITYYSASSSDLATAKLC